MPTTRSAGTSTQPSPWGELGLIERVRSGWGAGTGTNARRSATLRLGIGDDCAILRPPRGHEILVTTDFSLEGRHFRRDWHTPRSAGHRCLARGLSDLAAMGAKPLAAFLSLALPRQHIATAAGRAWVEAFFGGMRELGERFAVPLAGGDTAEAPGDAVLADIVLVGSAPTGRALRRSGADPGDLLYVTGALGGAAAELAATMRRAKPVHTPGPQSFPEPRIPVGLALMRRRLATAAIDLSDGLSTDVAHLCSESGVGAEVDAAHLPLHPLASAAGARAIDLALNGGEDYELLFAAPAKTSVPRRIAGVPITRIGRLVPPKAGVTLIHPNGERTPLNPAGWEHFAQ